MNFHKAFALSFVVALAACGPQNTQQQSEIDLKTSSGIVGGAEATGSDKLSLVKIVDGFNRICTGTLIAKDLVLTAAHCVKGAGDLDIIFAADPSVTIASKALRAHEKYETIPHEDVITTDDGLMKKKVEHKNDIGLILLSQNAPSKAVAARLNEKKYPVGTLTVRAVGYGRTENKEEGLGVLRGVDLDAMIRENDAEHFYFDQSVGKGICQGDSGGPIFTATGASPEVAGVVNGADDIGVFFGEMVGDQCLYTGVATQVSAYNDWILKSAEDLRKPFQNTEESTFEKGMTTDKAYCKKELPSYQQMKAELQAMTSANPTGNNGVGGLGIKNENPRLIDAYKYLVSYKTYQFKIQMEIDYWLIFKDLNCDKALCAAEKIFGSERGVLYLYVAAKYGLVLSHLGFDKLRPPTPADQVEFDAYFKVREWGMDELKPYLKALPMLPSLGLPLPFTRMNHAGIVNPVNKNVLSNGIIQFYSSMDKMSDSEKEQTTFHEIAHNYGSHYGFDHSKEWLAASGWKEVNNKFINEHPEQFVTRYASSNFFEDFAESFTYYRYYPAVLKNKSPERYEFFKKYIFSGKEYLANETCEGL